MPTEDKTQAQPEAKGRIITYLPNILHKPICHYPIHHRITSHLPSRQYTFIQPGLPHGNTPIVDIATNQIIHSNKKADRSSTEVMSWRTS